MRTVEILADRMQLIDQRKLPVEVTVIETQEWRVVADAIRTLAVRGAPAIGVAAAGGLALAARSLAVSGPEAFWQGLADAAEGLRQTRPTAVNLFWAIKRVMALADAIKADGAAPAQAAAALHDEAVRMAEEDVQTNRAMARYGQELIKPGDGVLTHCNTGSLATVDWGTALGVIRAAHEAGKAIHVFVDETRPVLQGARLTAWECVQYGIPATLITDNMAAHFMRKGKVQVAFVGADRIAANGDTANKIGTYGVAVLCKAHGIPFYVVAPSSTFDLSLESGDLIEIEERNHQEVTHIGGVQIAPTQIGVANPAFDVTPSAYITGIVTEMGIVYPPYTDNIKRVLGR